MHIKSVYILFLVWLCLAALGTARVQILSGPSNGTEIISAEFYKKGDNFNAVFAPLSGLLVDETSSDVNNRIVYVTEVPKSQFWPHIFALKDRGIIGVVYGADYVVPGQDYCTWTGEDVTQITFPIVEVNVEEFAEVHSQLTEGAQILIQMTSEGNPWSAVLISTASIIVFRVILGGYALSLAIYALIKLILFAQRQGSRFNVPQVCLALEVISNLWRVVYLVGDPMGCNFAFGSAANSFLDSVSLPYATATFVLITFYWHEVVTDASISIYPFLSKLQVPFFVIMFLLIATDLTVSLLGFYYEFSTTVALTAIYLVITLAFLIFYIVTLVRVMRRMRLSHEVRGDTGKFRRLSQVNTKMILNAVARFCIIVVGLAFIFPQVNRYPVPQMVLTALLFFTVTTDSLMRLLLFDVRATNSTSKKGTSSETKLSDVGATHSSVAL